MEIERVNGLPAILKPTFWKELIQETFWLSPQYDDEKGVVWNPVYLGDYADKVQQLSKEQMLTGLKNEMRQRLGTLSSEEARTKYLDKLSESLSLDKYRAKAEKHSEVVTDFSDDDYNMAAILTHEHAQFLKDLQALIHAAYSWEAKGTIDETEAMQPAEYNSFNGVPLNEVRDHFQQGLCINNAEGNQMLSEEDFEKFISAAFLGIPLKKKLTLNIGTKGNSAIGSVFHSFYVKSKPYEATDHCAPKYRKLATDHFSNWSEKRFLHFFRS